MNADVAIIGAGPAGTATALHLGQLGVKNVVLLDRHGFPRDKTCGSGVSPKGIGVLKELGVWDDVEANSYPINGLRLVTPGNREMFISGGDAAAAVICQRRTLDHLLLQRAQSLGAEFVPNFHAHELRMDDDRVVGVTAADGRTIRAKLTVVADGAHSRFTLQREPKTVYQAIMGWWDDVPFTPKHVELVFDKSVSPMYGWLFPESPTRVNIGIVYPDVGHQKNARQLFQAFLDKHYAKRLGGGRPVGKWQGHPVSYAYKISKLTAPGRIVVGEAGRMTSPATAEGIYQGMKSGMLAAEALKKIVTGERREAVAFRDYEAACRSTFRVSLWASRAWLSVVDTSLLDAIVGMAQHRSLKNRFGRVMANI